MASPILLLDFVEFSDFKNYPNMVTWLKKIQHLPYYEECNLEGINALKTMYCNALNKNKIFFENSSVKDVGESWKDRTTSVRGQNQNKDSKTEAENLREAQDSNREFKETSKNSQSQSGTKDIQAELDATGRGKDIDNQRFNQENRTPYQNTSKLDQDNQRSDQYNEKSNQEEEREGSQDSSFWDRPPRELSPESLERILASGFQENQTVPDTINVLEDLKPYSQDQENNVHC